MSEIMLFLKSFLKKIIFLFSAPRYVVPSQTLNQLGLQNFRIFIKTHRYFSNDKNIKKTLSAYEKKIFEKLSNDGIAIINNFVAEEDLEELNSEIKNLKATGNLKKEFGKEGGSVHWEHGNFPSNQEFPSVDNYFRKNPFLLKLVENYTHRKVISFPEVIYQKLMMPRGAKDEKDIQTILHADRHYRAIKVFYAFSEHSSNNGAFWYSKKSHIMSGERLSFEKDYSCRESLKKNNKSHKIDSNLLENGRNIIRPSLQDQFPPEQMCVPKNSLIIVDVCGFHKRGLMNESSERETLRMIFHYIHAPFWIQRLFKFLKVSPARFLN
ncbi:hypothetical protein N9Z16_03160 [Methylophilaceae bacterium]|nr:hypothetical protein [Methylophilaceae bacterium]